MYNLVNDWKNQHTFAKFFYSMTKGKAIIFSAPSGSGKTTIVKHLLSKYDMLDFSISATSRAPRGNEVNGREYFFLSRAEFKKKIQQNEFIEYEEVYNGDYYGTLKSEIDRIWAANKHVLFDVDVRGGLKLKDYFEDRALAIFVKIPDLIVLEKRLRERATDSEEKIKQRLAKANYEISFMSNFDVVIENNIIENTLAEAERLVLDFIKS
jgi:guanylate kinase